MAGRVQNTAQDSNTISFVFVFYCCVVNCEYCLIKPHIKSQHKPHSIGIHLEWIQKCHFFILSYDRAGSILDYHISPAVTENSLSTGGVYYRTRFKRLLYQSGDVTKHFITGQKSVITRWDLCLQAHRKILLCFMKLWARIEPKTEKQQ